jgi:hypothetical protein
VYWYIKRQLGTAIHLSAVKVTVAENRNTVSCNNLILLRPIEAELCIWVVYIKR